MGNVGSNSSNGRRRHNGGGSRRGNNQNHPTPPPPQQPQPEINANRYVFAAATPYPAQYPNPNPNTPQPHPPYYQYPTGPYYPPQPPPPEAATLSAPYDHHHRVPMDSAAQAWVGGRYPCGPVMNPPTPYVDHKKAVTIRNDVNLKKETLKIEPLPHQSTPPVNTTTTHCNLTTPYNPSFNLHHHRTCRKPCQNIYTRNQICITENRY